MFLRRPVLPERIDGVTAAEEVGHRLDILLDRLLGGCADIVGECATAGFQLVDEVDIAPDSDGEEVGWVGSRVLAVAVYISRIRVGVDGVDVAGGFPEAECPAILVGRQRVELRSVRARSASRSVASEAGRRFLGYPASSASTASSSRGHIPTAEVGVPDRRMPVERAEGSVHGLGPLVVGANCRFVDRRGRVVGVGVGVFILNQQRSVTTPPFVG